MGYGFDLNEPWDSSKHHPKDKYWDSLDEIYRASGQMEWFFRKVSLSHPLKFAY